MKAVVFNSIGDISAESVDDPRIEQPTDAIVRITTSAICGTDLHLVRGTFTGILPELIDIVASGRLALSPNITQQETFDTILNAYQAFDRREPGWIKVAVALDGESHHNHA